MEAINAAMQYGGGDEGDVCALCCQKAHHRTLCIRRRRMSAPHGDGLPQEAKVTCALHRSHASVAPEDLHANNPRAMVTTPLVRQGFA